MIQLGPQLPINLSYFYGRRTGVNEAIWESVVTSLAENWVTLLGCGYLSLQDLQDDFKTIIYQ